jgi:hypothetical protein
MATMTAGAANIIRHGLLSGEAERLTNSLKARMVGALGELNERTTELRRSIEDQSGKDYPNSRPILGNARAVAAMAEHLYDIDDAIRALSTLDSAGLAAVLSAPKADA